MHTRRSDVSDRRRRVLTFLRHSVERRPWKRTWPDAGAPYRICVAVYEHTHAHSRNL